MRLKTLLTTAVISAAMLGVAEARPDARSMSCKAVQNLVNQEGAVVISTGQYTYRRFVDRDGYCEFDQRRVRFTVATRDNPSCRVNGVCEANPFYDLPGFGDR